MNRRIDTDLNEYAIIMDNGDIGDMPYMEFVKRDQLEIRLSELINIDIKTGSYENFYIVCRKGIMYFDNGFTFDEYPLFEEELFTIQYN
jgi:hypothetical protein